MSLLSLACVVSDPQTHTDDADEEETEGDPEGGPGIVPACHPLDQAFNCDVPGTCGDCPNDSGCYPFSGNTAFECLPAGSGGFGASCTYATECQRGSLCVPREVSPGCSDGFGCCTWFCDVDEGGCPSGTYCAEYFGSNAPIGFESLGACVPKGA